MPVKVVNIDKLLANTQAFINTMYVVREDFSLTPNKNHIGTCINYADLIEMREEFIEELVHTVTQFVYSKNKQSKLVSEFSKDRDNSAAQSKLVKRAKTKFRTSYLQGQFSELLVLIFFNITLKQRLYYVRCP